MTGSIRLFISTLFIAHLSGVVGSRSDNGHNRKDQLRGHAREVNRNKKEEETHVGKIAESMVDQDQTNRAEIERSLEFLSHAKTMTWEDDQTGKGYDDYYSLPDDLAYTGNTADDVYFREGGDDNYFAQNSQSNQNGNNDENYVQNAKEDDYFTTNGNDYYYDTNVDEHYYTKSNDHQHTKGNDYNYESKVGKSEKYGNKSDKAGKSGKFSKLYIDDYYQKKTGIPGYTGNEKNSKTNKEKYFYKNSAEYDDHTEMDDIFHVQKVPDSNNYAPTRYYDTPTIVPDQGSWSTNHDDFFSPSSTSSTRSHEVKQSGRTDTAAEDYYYDDQIDDFFHVDEPIYFLPRPSVTIGGSCFSYKSSVPPMVPPGSQENPLTLGTEYLWAEQLLDSTNILSNQVPISVDNEIVNFMFAIDGYCIRIGPPDQNSVQGYCFFTYTAINPETSVVSGSFTAQGIIVNADVPGQMTVSGGTGIMTGAVGLVEILPAALDENFFPPLLIQPQPGADPFEEVAGWAHYFEITVDILFFLPELYAPPRPSRR